MRFLALLLATAPLFADERTRKLSERLAEEALAFSRLATQLVARETLVQRAREAPPRFRPRLGNPAQPRIREREIISDYSYATFEGESGALHELRQVVSVDGKRVQDSQRAEEALARAVTASDDTRKKQLLEDFAKYGLSGAVTDFGQILLLFSPRDIGRYEFSLASRQQIDGVPMLIFHYQQIDGPKAMTVIDARSKKATQIGMVGEVWVNAATYLPTRVTVSVMRSSESGAPLREQASVRYSMSSHGVLVPVEVIHRESEGATLLSENIFRYSEFKRFGASSDLKFDVDAEPPPP